MALHVIEDGLAARLGAGKRIDAAAWHALAREVLSGLDLKGDPRAYHLWLGLPDPWTPERFAMAAARDGVAVSPASAFAVGPEPAPYGVRLALGSPPMPRLETALRTLGRLVRDGDDAQVE
jgi:DNA-binding transcriptional MocR family regulator